MRRIITSSVKCTRSFIASMRVSINGHYWLGLATLRVSSLYATQTKLEVLVGIWRKNLRQISENRYAYLTFNYVLILLTSDELGEMTFETY